MCKIGCHNVCRHEINRLKEKPWKVVLKESWAIWRDDSFQIMGNGNNWQLASG